MNFLHSTSAQALDGLDDFVCQLCPNVLDIDILVQVKIVNDPVAVYIVLDDTVVYQQKMIDGSHEIHLDLPLSGHGNHRLTFGMRDKKPNDTVVENGQIVRDTYVEILDWKINNYCLSTDYEFYRNFIKYHNDDHQQWETAKLGFWNNSHLDLDFSAPFEIWYNQASKKNSMLADDLKHYTNTIVDPLVANLEQAVHQLER